MQFLFVNSFGLEIGTYKLLGLGRRVLSGTMGDSSFVSLYLAVGAQLLIIETMQKKKIEILRVVGIIVHILASILCSGRTGLLALIVTIIIYMIVNIVQGKKKFIFLLLLSVICIPFLIEYFEIIRGQQSFLDSSGRIEGYIYALKAWLKQPLMGIGLGIGSLVYTFGRSVPHNLIIQILLQSGIIGIVYYSIPFFVFFHNRIQYAIICKWLLLLIFIGAMLIPDIASSRFLNVVLLMSAFEAGKGSEGYTNQTLYF
jgi:hypothetical protein